MATSPQAKPAPFILMLRSLWSSESLHRHIAQLLLITFDALTMKEYSFMVRALFLHVSRLAAWMDLLSP